MSHVALWLFCDHCLSYPIIKFWPHFQIFTVCDLHFAIHYFLNMHEKVDSFAKGLIWYLRHGSNLFLHASLSCIYDIIKVWTVFCIPQNWIYAYKVRHTCFIIFRLLLQRWLLEWGLTNWMSEESSIMVGHRYGSVFFNNWRLSVFLVH